MIVWIVPISVFLGIAAFSWVVLDFILANRSRAEERLEDLRDPNARKKREELGAKNGNAVSRMLQAASPALAKPLQPKTEAEANDIKRRLCHAGFRSEAAPMMFQSLKVMGGLFGLFLGGGFALFTATTTMSALIRVGFIAGAFFFLPDIIVWFLAKKRKESIFLGLPDALDLMVVCVEAGLGLDQAMRKVADEMKKSYRTISEEFGICNLQMQVGRSRQQVLQELGTRSGVDDLRALASILIQADKFGSSIAQALRVQSEAMRTRRKQIAEEKAAQTAVKLIFPLVLFIFPGIFVVLVGPAAITMVREMFPAMNGG